jgi:hypothetical protein
MKNHVSYLWLFALAILLPGRSFGQDTRPRQLDRVLSGLQKNGENWLRQGVSWTLKREYVVHLMFMASDEHLGLGRVGGWYRPSQSRYDWTWLSRQFDTNLDGSISFDKFKGPREWFESLDKDRDGQLTRDDFSWYGKDGLARAGSRVKSLFYQIDDDGNGQVTVDEWKHWFDKLSGRKQYLSQDDLLPLFLEVKKANSASGKKAPMKYDPLAVAASYISGDVGSPTEGPAINDFAPDFTLSTIDGKGKLALSQHRGKKPLVVIFGSFT